MAAKIKKGDNVVVLTGKDKGKQGEIASVNPSANKAVVEGVNIAIRHTKQSQGSQGGRIAKAMPTLHSSRYFHVASSERGFWLK